MKFELELHRGRKERRAYWRDEKGNLKKMRKEIAFIKSIMSCQVNVGFLHCKV